MKKITIKKKKTSLDSELINGFWVLGGFGSHGVGMVW